MLSRWPHVKQDCDLIDDDSRIDGSAVSCFGTDLHRFRRAYAEDVSASLLCEQHLLRDFTGESRSSFATTCEGFFRTRLQRGLRRDGERNLPSFCFLRSTTSFFQRPRHRARFAATRGPLHVSHLIHRV